VLKQFQCSNAAAAHLIELQMTIGGLMHCQVHMPAHVDQAAQPITDHQQKAKQPAQAAGTVATYTTPTPICRTLYCRM
jgi:hypothetical protein